MTKAFPRRPRLLTPGELQVLRAGSPVRVWLGFVVVAGQVVERLESGALEVDFSPHELGVVLFRADGRMAAQVVHRLCVGEGGE